MKRLATVILVGMIVLLFAAPSLSRAQGDTLVVYANGPSLDAVIGGDTTSTGDLKHHVFKLVSTDTTYLFLGTITTKNNFTMLGVPKAGTGRPPCVQPGVLGNGTIPGVFLAFNGNGTKVNLKKLYLLGISVNNTPSYSSGQAVQISADSVRFAADSVVFENWSQFAIGYAGNWDKFFITNCKFRNMVTQPNQWYVGEVIRNENYAGNFPTDSLVMRYNTVLAIGGYAACPVATNPVKYFEFNHNNVMFNFKNPFFIHRISNAKINNNIFYNLYAGGQNKTEYNGGWDELTAGSLGSIISLDTMSTGSGPSRLDSLVDPGDVGNANLKWLAEAKRTIQVRNNAYFWSTQLTAAWKAWNDTAHTDSVYTPVFMNPRTVAMFADQTHWPGFAQSGNQNVDPGFGTAFDSVFTGGAGIDVGLIKWFRLVRAGTGTSEIWGYKTTQVGTAANWVPPWPLPETNAMKYTNAALKTGGTDGGPVGDPNWWGIALAVNQQPNVLPLEFNLSQNYPNPFNPATKLAFSLPVTAEVSLKVFNLLGQEVATLQQGTMNAGTHVVTFDASRLSSGVYFYTLKAGTFTSTRKMVLMK